MTTANKPGNLACGEFEADLVLYHYGECTEVERLRVEAHTRSCPGCARYLRQLAALLPLTVTSDEPPQHFWDDYSRELRGKLAAAAENGPWWKRYLPLLRSWQMPALATALLLILALTLTLNKTRQPLVIPPEDQALLAVLPMAENIEFFKAMDLLDAMDLLEVSGGLGAGSA